MAAKKTFTWGTGRRKTAIARVRLCNGEGIMRVNNKDWSEYFTTRAQQLSVRQPLKLTNTESTYDVHINVKGGGPQGQADAVRLGIARALVKVDSGLEAQMRSSGYLTRDARVSERKKYGQRGARARFQFSKR